LQGPVFLLNSWLNQFTETTSLWYALSRSYSVNLPSSFSAAHPSALEYSSRLPVSVYGTGRISLTLEVFLGGMFRITISPAEAFEYYHLRHSLRIFLQKIYLLALTQYSVTARIFHDHVTPSKLMRVMEY
jgi:hypothetical protein